MHEIELLRLEPGQNAGPRQIEIGDLEPHLLADGVDEVAVEALVGSVVGDIERRELHFGRGRELAALLDLRQRVVGEGGARQAENAPEAATAGQSALKRAAPGQGEFVELRHCRAPVSLRRSGLQLIQIPAHAAESAVCSAERQC